MANITELAQINSGAVRNQDLTTNSLLTLSVFVGGSVSPTELTKTVLDGLIAQLTAGYVTSVNGAQGDVGIPTAPNAAPGLLTTTDWTTFNGKQAALTFGNVSTSTTGVTVGNGSSSTVGPNVTVNIQTASASQPGLLSSTDWTTFNGKQAALSFGNVTDGSDGILSFTGATGAVIGSGLQITVQKASGSASGYLSSTDWTTFNGKQAALSFGNVTDGSDGILSFTGATGAVIGSGLQITVQKASGSASGYLSSTDWTTFNAKQSALTFGNVSTSTTGVSVTNGTSATVGPNVTVNIQTASGSQPGLLSSTDWNTFNGKQSALTPGSFSESTSSVLTITNGTSSTVGPNVTIQVKQASGSVSGYLSSTDWTTFNGKQAAGNYITALSSDVVASGPGSAAATIQSGVVTLAKMANLAANSIIGNNTASPATPLALTQAQVTAFLNQFSSTLQGVVPASGGGTTNFLRADGNWAVAGTGTVTAVTASSPLSSSGSTTPNITLSGQVAVANGGTGQTTATAALAALAGSVYDAVITVVASGGTPPGTVNGPISTGTAVTLPGSATFLGSELKVMLNGQMLIYSATGAYDYAPVGSSPYSQISFSDSLQVGDVLHVRKDRNS